MLARFRLAGAILERPSTSLIGRPPSFSLPSSFQTARSFSRDRDNGPSFGSSSYNSSRPRRSSQEGHRSSFTNMRENRRFTSIDRSDKQTREDPSAFKQTPEPRQTQDSRPVKKHKKGEFSPRMPINAVARLDFDHLKKLLTSGVNINRQDANGWTPLMTAVNNQMIEAVEFLLEKGADTCLTNRLQQGPLFLSATKKNAPITLALLKAGAPVDQKEHKGWTPLMAASNLGLIDTVSALLDFDASLSTTTRFGASSLSLAAAQGHVETVRLLLEKGADVDHRDNYMWTPLMSAASNGHEAVVRLLIEKGASTKAINNHGQDALMLSLAKPNPTTSLLILNGGADLCLSDSNGWTSLMSAIFSLHIPTIREMLRRRSALIAEGLLVPRSEQDFVFYKNRFNKNAFSLAVSLQSYDVLSLFSQEGIVFLPEDAEGVDMFGSFQNRNASSNTFVALPSSLSTSSSSSSSSTGPSFLSTSSSPETAPKTGLNKRVLEYLLEGGHVRVDVTNADKQSMLIMATICGQVSIAEYLLKKNAFVDHQDVIGWTALMYAADEGNTELFSLLLQAGASTDLVNNQGRNALIIAAANNHCSIVSTLLEKRVDLDHQDLSGWTAFSLAVNFGHVETIRLLLSQVPPPNVALRNKKNEHALDIAKRKRFKSIFDCIVAFLSPTPPPPSSPSSPPSPPSSSRPSKHKA